MSGDAGRKLGDLIADVYEETVSGFGVDDLAAGEGAEAGEDECVSPEEETRKAERGAFSVGYSDDGMPVTGDVEVVGRGVRGIVDDADGSEIEVGDGGESGGEMSEFGVVISGDEGEGDGKVGEEVAERLGKGGVDAGGCVEEVAGDDEMTGVGFVDEIEDAGEVAFVVALGDGESAGAEGGGFSEMDVGEDEGGALKKGRGLGEEVDVGGELHVWVE